jgi:hypothetical protein
VDAAGENAPELSLEAAKQLVVNRQRALGAKHPNTLEARTDLAEATGRSGDETVARELGRQGITVAVAAKPHGPCSTVRPDAYGSAPL